MGHDGMLYSLPSRELIADSVEYMANAHCVDALVCISNCDKITPGMLMAAVRLNIPAVFVSGGPMEAGHVGDKAYDLVDAMVSIDSCFSAIGSPKKNGYAKFASKAGRGSGLLVMTIGPGGGVGSGATLGPGGEDFSSAIDCVMASTASAGHFSKESVEGDLPEPDGGSALVSGGVVLLDYRRFRHDQHIHDLAVPVMQAYLSPFLAQTISPFVVKLVAGAVGIGLGWLAYDYL